MPVAIVLLMAAVFFVILGLVRILGGKYKAERYGTWDCGYESLNSRMQYSATGFSKPFRIIFRILYRPGRELRIEEGNSPYHPVSMKYNVSTEKIFEKYLYYPLLHFIKRFSKKSKYIIQTGSIHIYLTYIFVTLLFLMLYCSLSN
jgi:hypothetical protein